MLSSLRHAARSSVQRVSRASVSRVAVVGAASAGSLPLTRRVHAATPTRQAAATTAPASAAPTPASKVPGMMTLDQLRAKVKGQ